MSLIWYAGACSTAFIIRNITATLPSCTHTHILHSLLLTNSFSTLRILALCNLWHISKPSTHMVLMATRMPISFPNLYLQLLLLTLFPHPKWNPWALPTWHNLKPPKTFFPSYLPTSVTVVTAPLLITCNPSQLLSLLCSPTQGWCVGKS